MEARLIQVAALLILFATKLCCAEDSPAVHPRFGLYAPLIVDGESVLALVDTGATMTALSTDLEAKLGEPVRRAAVFGKEKTSTALVFKGPSLRFLNRTLDLPEVFTRDFSRNQRISGLPVSATVGLDALREHVLRIDFKAGRWELLAGYMPSQDDISLELTGRSSNDVRVSLGLGEIGADDFQIDLGENDPGEMKPELIAALEESKGAELIADSRFGTQNGRKYRLRNCVTLGSRLLPEMIFECGPGNTLGRAFLARFDQVVIDFKGERIHFRPGKNLSQPDRINRTGLWYWHVGNSIRVARIDRGSPAEEAGIQEGDVVLSLDGVAIDRARLLESREKMSWPIAGPQSEKSVQVVLERDKKRLSVDLPLNVWPKPPMFRRLP